MKITKNNNQKTKTGAERKGLVTVTTRPIDLSMSERMTMKIPTGTIFVFYDIQLAQAFLDQGKVTSPEKVKAFDAAYTKALSGLAELFNKTLSEILVIDNMNGNTKAKEYRDTKVSFLTGNIDVSALSRFMNSHKDKLQRQILASMRDSTGKPAAVH